MQATLNSSLVTFNAIAILKGERPDFGQQYWKNPLQLVFSFFKGKDGELKELESLYLLFVGDQKVQIFVREYYVRRGLELGDLGKSRDIVKENHLENSLLGRVILTLSADPEIKGDGDHESLEIDEMALVAEFYLKSPKLDRNFCFSLFENYEKAHKNKLHKLDQLESYANAKIKAAMMSPTTNKGHSCMDWIEGLKNDRDRFPGSVERIIFKWAKALLKKGETVLAERCLKFLTKNVSKEEYFL